MEKNWNWFKGLLLLLCCSLVVYIMSDIEISVECNWLFVFQIVFIQLMIFILCITGAPDSKNQLPDIVKPSIAIEGERLNLKFYFIFGFWDKDNWFEIFFLNSFILILFQVFFSFHSFSVCFYVLIHKNRE